MRTMLAAIGLAGATLVGGQAGFAVAVGDPFPVKALQHVQEGTLTPDDLKGKVTVINFWATWCEACKVELVEMEDQFQPFFKNSKFQAAFVSLDKEPAKAKEWFATKLKKPESMLPFLYTDSKFELAEILELDTFPMTYVVGPDGKVAQIQKGFTAGEGSTEKMVSYAAGILAK